jgi:hypothetical protein
VYSFKAISKRYIVSILAEFSLVDQDFAPTFRSPNGRKLILEDEDYYISQLKA